MFLLALVCVSIVGGHERNGYFRKIPPSTDVGVNLATVWRCVVLCVVDKSCLSFCIDADEDVCKLSAQVCKPSRRMEICYMRRWYNSLRRNHSKLKTTKTTKRDSNLQIKADNRIQKESYRLLLIQHRSYQQPTELNLQTMAETEHPHPNLAHVSAVTFMPQSSSLLVSKGRPSYITVFTLIKGEETKILKSSARALAVDEDSRVIFQAGQKSLSRMTLEGLNLTLLNPREKLRPLDLVTDVAAKHLYVSYSSYIHKLTYHGKNIQIIAEGGGFSDLSLDHEMNILYYSYGLQLMKRNLSGGENITVTYLKEKSGDIEFYKNRIFVSSLIKHSLCEVKDLDLIKKHTCKKLKLYRAPRRIIMCLI